MTVQEKNIAIAEMLGGVVSVAYENKTSGWIDYSITGDFVKDFREKYANTGGMENKMLESNLRFHSDANWQFEAIDWVEKQGYDTCIDCYALCHNVRITEGSPQGDGSKYFTDIVDIDMLDKKQAIFEALYQFSQYLKQKT